MIHRDLKPENILFEHGDCEDIKIIDFGFAFFNDHSSSQEKLGTPFYVSPEFLDGVFSSK